MNVGRLVFLDKVTFKAKPLRREEQFFSVHAKLDSIGLAYLVKCKIGLKKEAFPQKGILAMPYGFQ